MASFQALGKGRKHLGRVESAKEKMAMSGSQVRAVLQKTVGTLLPLEPQEDNISFLSAIE